MNPARTNDIAHVARSTQADGPVTCDAVTSDIDRATVEPGEQTAVGARTAATWVAPSPTTVAAALLLLALGARRTLSGHLRSPSIGHWTNVFIAVSMQALPFLVLGVVVSGAIATFLRPSLIRRALPKRATLAIPVAALSGVILPGCECSSVPVAARLAERGVPVPAALAFLLSAPAVNPVVLVATAVAFPHRPALVVARFVASVLTATIVGWIWLRVGTPIVARHGGHDHGTGCRAMVDASLHDFVHAGGYLVIGAAAAATLQTVVPRDVLGRLGRNPIVAVVALALLAIVLSICSEADAFVASGLTQFSLTARLVFLVVGPMVDLKLIALQAGTFGRRFAMRFAPLTVLVAVVVAAAVGSVLL